MSGPNTLHEPPLGRELLTNLRTGMRNRMLYPVQHPEVQQPIVALFEALTGALEPESEITLAIVHGEAFLNGTPLRDSNVHLADFLLQLAELQVELLRFTHGMRMDEVETVLEGLTLQPEALEGAGGLGGFLTTAGVSHVTCERLVALPGERFDVVDAPLPGDGDAGGTGGAAGEGTAEETPHPLMPSAPVQQMYGAAVQHTRIAFDHATASGRLDGETVSHLATNLVRELLTDPSAFLGLLHLRGAGEDMFHHAVNVAILSVLLSSKLDVEEEQLHLIGIGALLHDLGELYVPEEIRLKPGPLTDAEWAIAHEHPARGAKLVLGTVGFEPTVASVVLEHHAGYQGHGYPKLHGRKVHLYSRIVAVADAYDALTHPRPYQPDVTAVPVVEQLLRKSGTTFDPTVLKILVHTLGFYPPGTPVELSDGRSGLVEAPTPGQPFLPRVLVETATGFEQVDTSVCDEAGTPVITVAHAQGAPAIPATTAKS